MTKQQRANIPVSVETDVLFASRRRCCLCLYIDAVHGERRGQIAHLNQNPADAGFDNLVWLCLEHHDLYDSRHSQTKGYTEREVRRYRDRLYAHNGITLEEINARAQRVFEFQSAESTIEPSEQPSQILSTREYIRTPWQHPLWLEVNQPSLFAYKSSNRFDGVCLIERIDLPDGRIVIACIQVAGNPGISITNNAEYIYDQVCRQFSIPPEKLVWLEHYDIYEGDEWNLVTFETSPSADEFADPKWTSMTPALWRSLGLKPEKKLKVTFGSYDSKLRKLFPWPPEG